MNHDAEVYLTNEKVGFSQLMTFALITNDSNSIIEVKFHKMKVVYFVLCSALATLASGDPGLGPCGPRPPTKPDFDQNMVCYT